MAINIKLQLFRGTLASLQSLATTGAAGVMAWTTDSNELYVDSGTGNPGIGPGNAWQRVSAGNQVFDIGGPSDLTSLPAQPGDLATSASLGTTYILASYPAATIGNWKLIASAESGSAVDVVPLPGVTAHQFVTFIGADGVQHLAQPSFSDVSGTLSQTQLPASIGAGSNLTSIDCGSF